MYVCGFSWLSHGMHLQYDSSVAPLVCTYVYKSSVTMMHVVDGSISDSLVSYLNLSLSLMSFFIVIVTAVIW